MSYGHLIDSGVLADGTVYRVWQRNDPHGRCPEKIVYVDRPEKEKNRRRNYRWLKEQLKKEEGVG